MIRSGLVRKCLYLNNQLQLRNFSYGDKSNSILYSKVSGLNRQAKIMGKLFGQRLPGSKKRWYPSQDEVNGTTLFNASNLGKPSGSGTGKNTTRRMTVLNKLFMKHITDLLATGETSEALTGKGLQVTRVKISPDYACINVYWFGNGDLIKEQELEKELQRCSGFLRHELSQLYLIGEIPRIHFVRDKTNANLGQVEGLLKNIDFGIAETDDDDLYKHNIYNMARTEFYGDTQTQTIETVVIDAENEYDIPKMRNDVLGLNHRDIMCRIMGKMRKSKEAWDVHSQTKSTISQLHTHTQTTVDDFKKKLSEHADANEKFDKYLSKRRDWKTTSERKKEQKTMAYSNLDDDAEFIEQNINDENDYIHEDYEENRK